MTFLKITSNLNCVAIPLLCVIQSLFTVTAKDISDHCITSAYSSDNVMNAMEGMALNVIRYSDPIIKNVTDNTKSGVWKNYKTLSYI